MNVSKLFRGSFIWSNKLAVWGLAIGALTAFRAGTAAEELVTRLVQGVGTFYATARLEKVYLHLDKPVYATGETLWFKAYLVDGMQHRPDSASKVLYVELLSPQRRVVARRTLRLQGGLAHGDLLLPDTVRAGTYLLRAYTAWMRNAGAEFIYQRRLTVWPAATVPAPASASTSSRKSGAAGGKPGKADVRFFPEGGNLVDGLESIVAFKALDAAGRGSDVQGQVLDGQNQVVSTFKSRHLGMGTFRLTPVAGQRYRAVVTLPGAAATEFALPAVQPSGYVLRVTDAGDYFNVAARYHAAPGAPASTTVLLLSEVRGFLLASGQRPISGDEPYTARVPKAKMPAGIVHFTLFDEQGTPQAERLAFAPGSAKLTRVTITPDQLSYAPHAPVRLHVQVTDGAGQPQTAQLSLSVADASLAGLTTDHETIVSNLLLTSDLAGYVEDAAYYFRDQSVETRQALDELLLTQGWRRFVWKEVLAGTPLVQPYPKEQALALGGQVVGMGRNPISNSQLTFMQTRPRQQVLTATSDALGRFRFSGFDGRDTAVVTLQARRRAGGANVFIQPDLGPATTGTLLPPLPALPPLTVDEYARRSRQQQQADRIRRGDTINTIVLKNVTIAGRRQVVPDNDPRRPFPGAAASTVVNFAEMPAAQSGMSILQLLQGRVAGLVVSGTVPDASVQIRGQGEPLLLLDGQPVSMDFISSIPSNQVETVEVFKGADASIFGGQGGGGVLAIYTRRGNPNYHGPQTDAPGIATLRLPGYYRAREFYVPRYDTPPVKKVPDPRRSTLYWAPTVRTDAAGHAELTLFTGDEGGTFEVVAEGITPAGQPSRGTSSVVVKSR
jgi:hypothetical protein